MDGRKRNDGVWSEMRESRRVDGIVEHEYGRGCGIIEGFMPRGSERGGRRLGDEGWRSREMLGVYIRTQE